MELDLSKIKKVFFVGIGGIGISAIARMMHIEGKLVSGSDMSLGEVVTELRNIGISVTIGQDLSFIPKDTDLIVYTIAIAHYDQKLYEAILNLGIPARSYPQMLSIVTKNKYTIAVSGTHGKTTTTAMIAKILMDTGMDPSVIVGSLLKEYKSNLIVGNGDIFVVEACEYERSFLNIKPKILVITNIESDHLDYYKDISDIESAFSELILQTDDFVVCNPKDPATSRIVKNSNHKKIIDYTGYLYKVPKLSVPGLHNRMNAACALAVADILKISPAKVMKPISEFSGTWRRLDKRKETEEGVIIYDDYAHHPTEIKASLQALRELYKKDEKKLTIIFQPHLYSRTKALFQEFSESFEGADQVFLLPIYFARETKDETISSELLAAAILKTGIKVVAFKDFNEAEVAIGALNLGRNDVLVTMGAGEAYKVADRVWNLT